MPDAPHCVAARAAAAELALGLLDGTERGEVLAHVADCPDCQAHVQELTEAVDHLLMVAPGAEPPPGFETEVIGRIEAERGVPRTRRPQRRAVALAAAAVLLLLGGLGLGLLIGRDAGGEPALASAPMVDSDGETVGEVWRYGEDDAVLVVSVPAWSEIAFSGPSAPQYALRLELEGGSTTEVGAFTLGGGRSSWGIETDVRGADIDTVSVVDESGHVWCTGQFADSA